MWNIWHMERIWMHFHRCSIHMNAYMECIVIPTHGTNCIDGSTLNAFSTHHASFFGDLPDGNHWRKIVLPIEDAWIFQVIHRFNLSQVMWFKRCHRPPIHPWLGMVDIPPIEMVMTGGWFIVVLTTLKEFHGILIPEIVPSSSPRKTYHGIC